MMKFPRIMIHQDTNQGSGERFFVRNQQTGTIKFETIRQQQPKKSFRLLTHFSNFRRYKGEIEGSNRSVHMTKRSMSSDVRYETEDKEKTGSYDINPDTDLQYANVQRGSGTSGDYDFPDPYPQGKRTTSYENQGIQKVRVKKYLIHRQ